MPIARPATVTASVQTTICCYGSSAIRKVVWQITDRCSLGCPYCYAPSAGTDDLSADVAVEVLRGLRRKLPQAERLLFAGREPLLFAGLEHVVEGARVLGFRCSISTSGELLERDRVAALSEAGIEKVNVTANSFDESVHNASRPGGDLGRVLSAVDACLEMEVPVKVNVTVFGETYGTLGRTLDFLYSRGVRRFGVGLLHASSWESGQAIPSAVDIRLIVTGHLGPGASARVAIPPLRHLCCDDRRCPGRRGLVGVLPNGALTRCNIYPGRPSVGAYHVQRH